MCLPNSNVTFRREPTLSFRFAFADGAVHCVVSMGDIIYYLFHIHLRRHEERRSPIPPGSEDRKYVFQFSHDRLMFDLNVSMCRRKIKIKFINRLFETD